MEYDIGYKIIISRHKLGTQTVYSVSLKFDQAVFSFNLDMIAVINKLVISTLKFHPV